MSSTGDCFLEPGPAFDWEEIDAIWTLAGGILSAELSQTGVLLTGKRNDVFFLARVCKCSRGTCLAEVGDNKGGLVGLQRYGASWERRKKF